MSYLNLCHKITNKMRIISAIIAITILSSCNQSKIDDLTSKVATLKKDSVELTNLSRTQQMIIDSLNKKVIHLDSLIKKSKTKKSSGYTCTYCGIHFTSMWDRCAQNTRGSYHVPVGGYSQFTDQDIKNAMRGK